MTEDFPGVESDLTPRGQLLYTAHMTLWLWLLLTLIVAPAAALSLYFLIWSEQSLGSIPGITFTLVGLGVPVLCVDTLFRRVLFYERCIVTCGLFRKTRCIEYSVVTSIARDRDLTIYLTNGRPIHVPMLEGNFDRIEEIVQERRAATVATDALG